MVNTPIPHNLKSEAKKAAKILQDFSMPNAKTGPDKIIPADTIANAAGLCILSVFKLGFLITARGGSGIVIAKLDDGTWSAPSAIGIAGLGGGFELGAEVTDFVIILNKKSAVEAFSKGGNLTIGGNFSVAAGPVGRNMEGDIAVRSPAAIYTYSKTKGIFAGVSIEGSYLIERKDANRKFYGCDIRAYDILSGEVERPNACFALYDVLGRHHVMYLNAIEASLKRQARQEAERGMRPRERSASCDMSRGSHNKQTTSTTEKSNFVSRVKSFKMKKSKKSKDGKAQLTRSSSMQITSSRSSGSTRHEEVGAVGGTKEDCELTLRGRALWDFEGQIPCDLSFKAGDVITILTRTETQIDWWEGSLNGRIGIFPANYIQLIR